LLVHSQLNSANKLKYHWFLSFWEMLQNSGAAAPRPFGGPSFLDPPPGPTKLFGATDLSREGASEQHRKQVERDCAEGEFMDYSVARRSLGLCAGELDYFAPLLGIVSDELAEVRDRAGKYHAPKVGKPRLQLGISEPRIDLAIELINDLGRCIFGRTEANPLASLETRHEIAHSGDIRECL